MINRVALQKQEIWFVGLSFFKRGCVFQCYCLFRNDIIQTLYIHPDIYCYCVNFQYYHRKPFSPHRCSSLNHVLSLTYFTYFYFKFIMLYCFDLKKRKYFENYRRNLSIVLPFPRCFLFAVRITEQQRHATFIGNVLPKGKN